jgi:hypothetical protein
MMADQLKLCIFGDQTFDLTPHWKGIFHIRSNPAVEDFLVKAYNAIRKEVFKLPHDVRDDLPCFTCINDLILSHQSGKRCVAIDMAVTCIFQLATFIRYVQNIPSDYDGKLTQYSQADTWYHGEGEHMVTGLCLGGLAAAAVSCSRTTLDLIPRAVDAVVAAFRVGMHASDTAKRLVPRASQDDLEGNWSMLFGGSMSVEALNKFCERKVSLYCQGECV